MQEQMKSLQNQGRQVEIDSDTLRKVIRETKEMGVKTILFIGGEPFLRKDLFDLISYAKEMELNPIIVTNGVLLDEKNINMCFDSGIDWLSVSIDAATESVFSKIRGEKVLEKITNNIKLLNRMKKDKKKEFPKLVVCSTVMDDNLEELLAIVNLCRELEIERILFQPVVANNIDQSQRDIHSSSFVAPGRLEVLNKAIDDLINYKKESLENFSFIANSIKNFRLIKRYFAGKVKPWEQACYAGYNRLQIVQEGKVYFCINQKNYEANFGDIRYDSLKDLWYSKKARFYRKIIRKCKYPCLQWCSYRDEFIELLEMFQKKILFKEK